MAPPMMAPMRPITMSMSQPKPEPFMIFPVSQPATMPMTIQPRMLWAIWVLLLGVCASGVQSVGDGGRVVLRGHSGCAPFAQVPCPLGFDLHATGFTCKVVAEAAPEPVFRLFDEAVFDGIAMD